MTFITQTTIFNNYLGYFGWAASQASRPGWQIDTVVGAPPQRIRSRANLSGVVSAGDTGILALTPRGAVKSGGIKPRVSLLAAVAWLITCCAVDSLPLNSERIQQRFGSYGLEIIEATDSLRHSSLYSMHDGTPITRTFAAVRFLPCSDKAIQELHARVIDGASIGATFKAAGWTVEKDTAFIIEMPVGEISADIAPRMRVSATTHVAIQAYRLRLVRPGAKCRYADILEIHHPDHLDVGQLRLIFGPADAKTAPQSAAAWFRRLGLSRAKQNSAAES